MVKTTKGVWRQSLTVEEPDDIGKLAFTPVETKRLDRFLRTFCPYKRSNLDPQRKQRMEAR